MNIVDHDLIEKYLNHSLSEGFPLVVAVGRLGHGMNGSDVSANLSSMKSSILEKSVFASASGTLSAA